MEVEQSPEIDDLASDQVFTDHVTDLGQEEVNELSCYNCAQLHMVIRSDRVILSSDTPFTLRRFRSRLQINFTPQYRYEYWVGEEHCLTRDDTLGSSPKPLRTYFNRFEEVEYIATLEGATLPLDAEKVKEETESYIYRRLMTEHNLWLRLGRAKEKSAEVEMLVKQLWPQYAELEARFRLGYAELHRRRADDLRMLTTREPVPRSEWVLIGPNVLPRFFNGIGSGLSVENRTLHPLRPTGNVITQTLWPYDRPFRASQCTGPCRVHCK